MLSIQQLDDFKRTGVLVLRNFFSSEEVAQWREEIFNYFDVYSDTSADWEIALKKHSGNNFRLLNAPTPASHSKLSAVFSQLNADITWEGYNQLLIRSPDPSAAWLGARAPHIDFPVGQSYLPLVNTFIYLSNINSHGGAFMYWPGSHITGWRHFKDTPLDYLSRGTRSQDQTFADIKNKLTGEPVEFLGRSGDILLWHHLLFHSASVNTREVARIALVGRFGTVRSSEGEVHDFANDIWHHWRFQPAQ